jgi:hypothetical protein
MTHVDWVDLVAGRPDEIWAALCGLARMALTGREPT